MSDLRPSVLIVCGLLLVLTFVIIVACIKIGSVVDHAIERFDASLLHHRRSYRQMAFENMRAMLCLLDRDRPGIVEAQMALRDIEIAPTGAVIGRPPAAVKVPRAPSPATRYFPAGATTAPPHPAPGRR